MKKSCNYVVAGGIAALLVLVGLDGCSWQHERMARESGRTSTQVAQDEQISDRVSDALQRAPTYKFPDVGVKAFNGVVQLNGFVATDAQKNVAAQIAQSSPGVVRVINDIQVQAVPLTPTGRTNAPNPNASR